MDVDAAIVLGRDKGRCDGQHRVAGCNYVALTLNRVQQKSVTVERLNGNRTNFPRRYRSIPVS